MDNIPLGRETLKAAVAGVVAFFVLLWLQAVGAGRWVGAAVSGAVGGLAVAALFS